jgi:hypothetical protein
VLDSRVPKATRSIPDPLYKVAKCQLYKVARTAEPGLREAARRVPGRHNVASDSLDI